MQTIRKFNLILCLLALCLTPKFLLNRGEAHYAKFAILSEYDELLKNACGCHWKDSLGSLDCIKKQKARLKYLANRRRK
jgi:hypothetical protein